MLNALTLPSLPWSSHRAIRLVNWEVGEKVLQIELLYDPPILELYMKSHFQVFWTLNTIYSMY